MQKEATKFSDSLVFEGMTSIRALIGGIDGKITDRRIEKVIFDKTKLKKISKEVGYFRAVSEKYGFELVPESTEHLDDITLGNSHGGIVAIATDRNIPLLDSTSDIKSHGFYVMIQGIEDPYNFGYSLRSLYSMGVSGVILSPRNWMSAAGVVCRSSAGASELLPMYLCEDEGVALDVFKERGYKIVCADERTDNLLGKTELPFPLLLIVGGEKRGISRSIVDRADVLIKIPYANAFRASLSAASATTMFAYEIMRQNLLDGGK